MAMRQQDYFGQLSGLGGLGLQQSTREQEEMYRQIAMMNSYANKIADAEKVNQKPQNPKKPEANPVLLLLEV